MPYVPKKRRTYGSVLGKRKAGTQLAPYRRFSGNDSNQNTMGAFHPVTSVIKVPYSIRELKHHNQGFSGGSPASTSTLTFATSGFAMEMLGGISQGTTAQQRVGNSIKLKNFNFRYILKGQLFADSAALAVNHTELVRVLVMYDRDGVEPGDITMAQFWSERDSNEYITAFPRPEFLNSFKILYDKTHSISHGISGQMQPVEHTACGNIGMPFNRTVNYVNKGTTGVAIPDCRLYIMFVREKGGVNGSSAVSNTVYGEVQYTDL